MKREFFSRDDERQNGISHSRRSRLQRGGDMGVFDIMKSYPNNSLK